MAGSLNKVLLIGRLGRDPEVRYTQSGQAVATLNMATDESYTDKNTGQKVEKAEWHRIVVWGRQAEFCNNYLGKGRLIYVEGSLQTRKWQDQQGQERYTTEIKAFNVQALDSKPQAGGYMPAPHPADQQYQQAPKGGSSAQPPSEPEDSGPVFPSEVSGMDESPF